MDNFRSPKSFLLYGGIVLVLVGVLGYVGLIGPTPEDSLFGGAWWFDNGENLAHTVLGVVALLAAFLLKDAAMQKNLVLLVGVLALAFTIIGVFLSGNEYNFLGVANLENPLDTILHLVVAVWAFWAGTGKKMMTTTM